MNFSLHEKNYTNKQWKCGIKPDKSKSMSLFWLTTIHFCFFFSFSLFLSETTSTGLGIRFWAWPDWQKMSWQRSPTSCYLTWRVEGLSPGHLCPPPLIRPQCPTPPHPAVLPWRSAKHSPRVSWCRSSAVAGDFFLNFFFSKERKTCVSVSLYVCVTCCMVARLFRQRIKRNTCQKRISYSYCWWWGSPLQELNQCSPNAFSFSCQFQHFKWVTDISADPLSNPLQFLWHCCCSQWQERRL